jgi:hypothetical protein
MNEVAIPMFALLGFAAIVLALLALGVWTSRRIANRETRPLGVTVGLFAAGLLAVALLGTWTLRGVAPQPSRVAIQERHWVDAQAPVPAARVAPGAGVWQSSSATISGSSAEMHAETGGTHHVHFHQGAKFDVAQVELAWAPIAIVTLIVGAVVLVAASRRGTSGILAGLGIVVGLLFLYVLSFRSQSMQTAIRPPTPVPPVVESITTPAPSPFNEGVSTSPTTKVEQTDTHTAVAEAAHADADKAEVEESKTEPDTQPTPSETTAAEKDTTKPKTPPPAWVGSKPTIVGGVYQATAVSGPYATEWECEERLQGPLQEAVQRYARNYLPPNVRGSLGLSADYIRQQLVKETYLEPVQASFGPMLKMHVLLKIDQKDVARFQQIAHAAEVRERVSIMSAWASGVLGTLVVVYGGLVYAGRKKPTPPSEPAPAPAEANV